MNLIARKNENSTIIRLYSDKNSQNETLFNVTIEQNGIEDGVDIAFNIDDAIKLLNATIDFHSKN